MKKQLEVAPATTITRLQPIHWLNGCLSGATVRPIRPFRRLITATTWTSRKWTACSNNINNSSSSRCNRWAAERVRKFPLSVRQITATRIWPPANQCRCCPTTNRRQIRSTTCSTTAAIACSASAERKSALCVRKNSVCKLVGNSIHLSILMKCVFALLG